MEMTIKFPFFFFFFFYYGDFEQVAFAVPLVVVSYNAGVVLIQF